MLFGDYYLEEHQKYVKIYGDKTCVLMQCGHFFEVYAVDNETEKINAEGIRRLSEIMNIQLTRKNKKIEENNRKNLLMIGIPLHAIEKYLTMLLNANYTSIVIEQISEPPDPQRKVTGIYSPGTNMEYNIKSDSNNLMTLYIDVIANGKMFVGLSAVDVSTGKCEIYETYSRESDLNYALDDAYRYIKSIEPSEMIIYASDKMDYYINYLEIEGITIHKRDKLESKYEKLSFQDAFLRKLYPDTGMLSVLEYLGLEHHPFATIALISSIEFAYSHNEDIVRNIEKPKIIMTPDSLILATDTIYQLNIVGKSKSKFGSLFNLINQTHTPMGRRLLKERLLHPLKEIQNIEKRYEAVEWGRNNYKDFEKYMANIPDLTRLNRKMNLGMLSPCDFMGLDIAYRNIQNLLPLLQNIEVPTIETQTKLSEFIECYTRLFNLDEMSKNVLNPITSNFYKKGIHKDIDDTDKIIQDSLSQFEEIKTYLEKALNKYSKKKGIIQFKKGVSEGFYLELTNNRAKILFSIIDKFDKYGKIQRSGGTKSTTRLTSSTLNQLAFKLTKNLEKQLRLVKDKYIEDLSYLHDEYGSFLKEITDYVADLDVAMSCGKTSIMYGYSRPLLKEGDVSSINFTEIRHPLIERIQTDTNYITNDLNFDIDKGVLLFGTNASGKSSLMKAIGMSVIMAQAGMYVPCKQMTLVPYDFLFTRINNNDNLFKGKSSFAVEMSELRGILKRSNKRSIVIGDELCSGTESISALSIFSSSVIHLKQKESTFIFATHLHELNNIIKDEATMYHLEVVFDEEQDTLVYNRKLKPGSGKAVYGLEVCKSMDMDKDFIDRAYRIRRQIMNIDKAIVKDNVSKYNAEVIVDKCGVCGMEAEDVHHILFQCNADANQMIGHIKKDSKSNLIPLCKNCHVKVHNHQIEIKGYIMTSEGKKLDFSQVEEKRKKNKKKYSEEQLVIIKNSLENFGANLSYKVITELLKSKHNIDISQATLGKIKRNQY